ncbi:hypothetical protein FHS61_000255 [Altererythrobacter atlanticus]|uniref:Uncharacterized protein n=1 Tax=Croceibacterium atlanticum TaxID=1267766 RepID=A0A0F7KUM3_9SPHN|nr:hypothetical protein [Croceibacterium atlanticum]AKH42485.1 hypothetical protein WYH_01444 [Croceibacterium atlanticum]MBB5731262.1 hypothetical protein [Croceibacterium atlanticum]
MKPAKSEGASFRGQPLLLIAFALAGWIGLRAGLLQFPGFVQQGAFTRTALAVQQTPLPAVIAPFRVLSDLAPHAAAAGRNIGQDGGQYFLAEPAAFMAGEVAGHIGPMAHPVAASTARAAPSPGIPLAASQPVPFTERAEGAAERHWLVDSWLLLRDGGGPALAGVPSYGRSQ